MTNIISFPTPKTMSFDLDAYADFGDFVDAMRRGWSIMNPGEPLPIELMQDGGGDLKTTNYIVIIRFDDRRDT